MGSNPVQASFVFRLSFRNCLSCVYNCDDHSLIQFTLHALQILLRQKNKSKSFLQMYTICPEWLPYYSKNVHQNKGDYRLIYSTERFKSTLKSAEQMIHHTEIKNKTVRIIIYVQNQIYELQSAQVCNP